MMLVSYLFSSYIVLIGILHITEKNEWTRVKTTNTPKNDFVSFLVILGLQ